MFVSIGQAAELIGVAVSTLRRWEQEERFLPAFRTKGNHRRYRLHEIRTHFLGQQELHPQRKVIAYARVSSHDQKEDLKRQIERLEKHCLQKYSSCEVISDLGSGINYNKKGLAQLIQAICSGSISTLVLTHKDRLLRFGSPLLFKLCDFYGTNIEVLDQHIQKDFETELVGDVIEIMTVFTAKIYGRRSHAMRRAA